MKLILKHISPWFIIWIARVTEGHSTEGLPADRFTATRESAYTVRKDGVATELVLKQEFYDQEGREVQWGGHLSRPSERHRITIVDKAGADGKARVLVDHDSPYSIFDWYTICHVHVDGYQLYLVRFGQQMAGAGFRFSSMT